VFSKLFFFKIEEKFNRKSFNILAIRGPTMLAGISKVAQILVLSYGPFHMALGCLLTRPGQFPKMKNENEILTFMSINNIQVSRQMLRTGIIFLEVCRVVLCTESSPLGGRIRDNMNSILSRVTVFVQNLSMFCAGGQNLMVFWSF
jgi:hypothetical protein